MKRLYSLLRKKSNSGSTMVTVIIVVAFMSILGTIALYISGANYKMKVVDNANKRSFYAAEEVVEILKTQLTLDVATATQHATKAAGATYVEVDSVAVREEEYLKNFKSELKSIWNAHWDDTSGAIGASIDYDQAVNDLFGGSVYPISDVNVDGKKLTFKIEINGEVLFCEINDMDESFTYKSAIDFDGVTTLLVPSTKDPSKNVPASYTLKDFNITVTDSKGFTSVIRTSFKITPPSLNWDNSKALTGEKTDASNPTGVISEADYSDSVMYYKWSKE